MAVGEMRQAEVTQTAKDKESAGQLKKKKSKSHKITCFPSQDTNCVPKKNTPTYSGLLLTHERFFHLHLSILLQPPHHQTRNKNHSSKIIGSPHTPLLNQPVSDQESPSDHRGLPPAPTHSSAFQLLTGRSYLSPTDPEKTSPRSL